MATVFKLFLTDNQLTVFTSNCLHGKCQQMPFPRFPRVAVAILLYWVLLCAGRFRRWKAGSHSVGHPNLGHKLAGKGRKCDFGWLSQYLCDGHILYCFKQDLFMAQPCWFINEYQQQQQQRLAGDDRDTEDTRL